MFLTAVWLTALALFTRGDVLPRPNYNYIHSPLCASNFGTFASRKHFWIAQKRNPSLKVLHRGKCKRICQIYAPVCGSNDQTYNNLCHLDYNRNTVKNLHYMYNGKCVNRAKSDNKHRTKLFQFNYYDDTFNFEQDGREEKQKLCALSK
ncbi:uncharacterized protein LOC123690989 [Colias croceus]|uniref:uncharacterized protein LOC123690989 n=1 Tax=Colias crocea TaxID=72248 RepID=UPI001E27F124|nr:uncharacterized protein LOC123690989 [Colias croceus]